MTSLCFVATTPFAVNAFLLNHLNELSREHHVTLCVNLEAYPLAGALSSRVTVINVALSREISLARDLAALLHLLRLFRGQAFAAVHSVTPKAGLLTMIAAFVRRVPHRHHTFTGQVWATRSGVRRIFLKYLDKLIAVLATQIFSDSFSQSKFLEKEGISKNGVVRVLGTGSIAGVALGRFQPDIKARQNTRQLLKVEQERCVFLFVGRLARDKGIADLVEAFIKTHKNIENVALWIVGPDEEGLQQALTKSAGYRPCGITWVGPTFEPEAYMAAADVLVLPSYREGFGMVIIEAAACAIPTLAYRIDGVIDAVVDGETGILCRPGDTEQLSGAMTTMARDASIRREMGSRALERVRKEFSADAVTAAWLDFYTREVDR